MGDDLAAPLPVNGMGVMVARILGGYMPWAGTATGKTLAKLVVDDFDEGTGTGPRPKYRTPFTFDVTSLFVLSNCHVKQLTKKTHFERLPIEITTRAKKG